MDSAKTTVFFIALLFIYFSSLQNIAAKNVDDVRGESFSDPTVQQNMPMEWINKTIQYDKKNKDADLVVTLNQQYYGFIRSIIDQYAEEKGLKIIVNKGTCGISAGMLAKKKGDIGALCCPPAKTDRLPGLAYHTIGIHPISVLTHPDNPISDLSLEQTRSIFQGDINRWSQIGWQDEPIHVVARPHCKKRPGHWQLLLENVDLFSPEARLVGAIEDMYSLVSSLPSAIGYEMIPPNADTSLNIKTLKIDGMHPNNLDHLLNNNYPIYRVLSLSTWEEKHLKKDHANLLVDYIVRELGKKGKKAGVLSVTELRNAGWKFRNGELIGEPE